MPTNKALKKIKKTLQKKPTSTLHQTLADLLKNTKPDKAIKHYYKALKINPNHVPTHQQLSQLLSKQNRHKEAETIYTQLIKLTPNSPNTKQSNNYNQLGNTYKSQHNIEAAKKRLPNSNTTQPSKHRCP